MNKTIIYICGAETHGKSTSAKLLNYYSPKWRIMKIGEPIKQISAIITSDNNQETAKEHPSKLDPSLTNRDIQIKISAALMKAFDENIWTTVFESKLRVLEDSYIVVDDARFPNQIDKVKADFPNYKIITAKIIDSRKPDDSQEPTERSLDDYKFDITILNDGTILDLRKKLINLFGNI